MSKVFNMVGGGGKNISSIVITGLSSTDTLTCTKDGKSYPATWDETTQHWEIVGLPLGTFTITATNGSKTITETVLIDIAGVYEVEMSPILWLYNEGNECEDITGGWYVEYALGSSGRTFKKNSDSMYASSPTSDNFDFIGTRNKINTSQYSKICIDTTLHLPFASNNSIFKFYYETFIRSYDTRWSSADISQTNKVGIFNGRTVLSIPTSNVNGYVKFYVNNQTGGSTAPTATIHKVWLE